jgi:hypothetical protein
MEIDHLDMHRLASLCAVVALAVFGVAVAPCRAAETYDLVIAGGTLDAVRLAVKESKAGQKVFLVAPRPYLGEDRAATLILDRLPTDDVNDPLIREIFNPAYRAAGAYNNLKSKGWRAVQKFEPYEKVETAPVPVGELDTVTTPLIVKRACDRALLAAGVKYLTGAQVIGVEPMADGAKKILISMRDKDQTVTARAFADHRLPASVAKGKGRFSFRYVANAGGKVRVEKIDFEYDVPYAGVRGWMAVQNHARTLVPISRDLLDVAEMVTVEGDGAAHSTLNPQPSTLDFDVVVAGCGTGGGPAALAAARSGAKTLAVEFQHVLGGVSTEGRIGGYGGYYDGNVTGFTTELDLGAKAIGHGCAYFFAESEFLRRGIVEAGGEVWLGAMVSGAEVKDGRLVAVKVTLPDGSRVSVPCKAAVDATGNCDLAAAAGCATEYIDPQELSVQGVGMAGQPLGVNCCNSDIGFVDETDAEDLCAFALRSRLSLPDRIWNQSSLVDSRERRRILGRFRITPIDLLLGRTYPDTVSIAESRFDTHGQTVHPVFFMRGTGKRTSGKIRGNVPFRALLPREVDGIIVTGLGISAHRDSMPVLRMKADIRNMGYAAGIAAATAAKSGVAPHEIDIKALQRRLVEIGNLPAAVLDMKDSMPLTDEALAAAAKRLPNGYDGIAEILSDPARAMPFLKRETSFEAMYVRAMLGDPDAAPALVKHLEGAKWDEGWNFKGMSQYDRSVSEMDAVVIALGLTRSEKALPVLDSLARQLTGESEYSHFRAIARACDSVGGRTAAAILAGLLSLPNVAGHAVASATPPPIPGYSDIAMNAERSDVLRELSVAAALYRLGDPDGSAKRSLTAYLNDPRRIYANFAQRVLHLGRNGEIVPARTVPDSRP